MRRYRVIYSTTPAGGFTEFSAVDDADAVEKAIRDSWNGHVVSLTEETSPTTARKVPTTKENR